MPFFIVFCPICVSLISLFSSCVSLRFDFSVLMCFTYFNFLWIHCIFNRVLIKYFMVTAVCFKLIKLELYVYSILCHPPHTNTMLLPSDFISFYIVFAWRTVCCYSFSYYYLSLLFYIVVLKVIYMPPLKFYNPFSFFIFVFSS